MSKELRENMKDKDIKTLITSGTIIIAGTLYLLFSDKPDETVQQQTNTQVEQTSTVSISTQYAEKITGNTLQQVQFLSVNDGDTFKIEVDGEKKSVRLLMIDTPEMNYDKGQPMPFAEEAKAYTEKILKEAKTIEVLLDKGPKEDNYKRLLAYVYVDGKMLQESLLEAGYGAIRYVNEPNNSLEKELRQIQEKAKKAKLGIWSIEGYFENNRFQENIGK